MSVENENIEQLVERARKLCLSITEACTNGFITDAGGTLQNQVHDVMASARLVEWELDPEASLAELDAADAHLEAQVENDLGDVDL